MCAYRTLGSIRIMSFDRLENGEMLLVHREVLLPLPQRNEPETKRLVVKIGQQIRKDSIVCGPRQGAVEIAIKRHLALDVG